MNELFKVIGCKCENIFHTRAVLKGRCPKCGREIPLFSNRGPCSTKVFWETLSEQEAIKVSKIFMGDYNLRCSPRRLTREELGL